MKNEVASFSSLKLTCPICNGHAIKDHQPFCSDRCRMVDLGRWLGESYRIPGTEIADKDYGEPV